MVVVDLKKQKKQNKQPPNNDTYTNRNQTMHFRLSSDTASSSSMFSTPLLLTYHLFDIFCGCLYCVCSLNKEAVGVSMVLGPEDGEQETKEKHHQAKANQADDSSLANISLGGGSFIE